MRIKHASLLAGLLFDGEGHRLSPTHANKQGRRYRYYVSHPLVCGRRAKSPNGLRISAGEIEDIVSQQVCEWLGDASSVLAAITSNAAGIAEQEGLIREAQLVAANWPRLSQARKRAILIALIQRIDLHPDCVQIAIYPSRLAKILRGAAAPDLQPDAAEEPAPVLLSAPIRLQRVGVGLKMLVDGPDRSVTSQPARRLIKLIIRAQALRRRLEQANGRDLREIARAEKMDRSYFTRILRLAYLAPDITAAILEGRQPAGLTPATIIESSRLPVTWPEQRLFLGFAS